MAVKPNAGDGQTLRRAVAVASALALSVGVMMMTGGAGFPRPKSVPPPPVGTLEHLPWQEVVAQTMTNYLKIGSVVATKNPSDLNLWTAAGAVRLGNAPYEEISVARRTQDDLEFSGRIVQVRRGASVRVLAVDRSFARVLVTEGSAQGVEGFVSRSALQVVVEVAQSGPVAQRP
jgi:hypothetical protein